MKQIIVLRFMLGCFGLCGFALVLHRIFPAQFVGSLLMEPVQTTFVGYHILLMAVGALALPHFWESPKVANDN